MNGGGSAQGWRAALAGRWRDFRNRLIADPHFRDRAERLPLTRPIARRRARELFDLCAGFVYSQVLLACVRLNLFHELARGPRTIGDLAVAFRLTPDAATRLLRAAASLRLAEAAGGNRYALGDLGAALVANPGVLAMIEHHALLYADLADPVALLRGEVGPTRLSQFWPYAGAAEPEVEAEGDVAAYSTLMTASQHLVASDILGSFPFAQHRFLLDVGGGEGNFAMAAAQRFPELRVAIVDLPAVAALAARRIDAAGLAGRVDAIGADFLKSELPTGADVVTLVRVAHDHDDDTVRTILRAIRRSIAADGVLVLAEPMSDAPGAAPMGDAYFGFYLLAMGRGRPRRPAELAALLQSTGFKDVRTTATPRPMLTGMIVARPDPATSA